MNTLLALLFLNQFSFTDIRNMGWAIAILSGYGVKVAFDVSEKIKTNETLGKIYWIGQICSVFVTFVVGYYSKGAICKFTDNLDLRAGLYAIIGAVGFELFRIFYRIVTNKELWEQFVGILMNRYGNSPYKNSDNMGYNNNYMNQPYTNPPYNNPPSNSSENMGENHNN